MWPQPLKPVARFWKPHPGVNGNTMPKGAGAGEKSQRNLQCLKGPDPVQKSTGILYPGCTCSAGWYSLTLVLL